MFEALFILTTIDAGTRVARFIVQEFVGRVYKPFGRHRLDARDDRSSTGARGGSPGATSSGPGSIGTIWPMFGIANQLLAVVALLIGTTIIINLGQASYVWVTVVPLIFVATTTLTAGYMSVRDNFWPLAIGSDPTRRIPGLPRLRADRDHDGVRRRDPGHLRAPLARGRQTHAGCHGTVSRPVRRGWAGWCRT